MRRSRRLAHIVTAGCLAVATLGLTACSGDDKGPDLGPLFTADNVKAGLMQPKDLGTAWIPPDTQPPADSINALCGGGATRPKVPGSPSVVASSLADEGDKGAQTFDQIGLVYGGPDDAESAIENLHSVAEACQVTVSHSAAAPTSDNPEAAYTETTTLKDLSSGKWSGFVVLRHKVYSADSPGVVDTAVAVLTLNNAVIVGGYGVYLLTGPELPGASPSPNASPLPSANTNFSGDWQRLVGSFATRVDSQRAKK
jgi:hypothetical protein